MIMRVQSDDGQDFVVQVCEGTGGIAIATANCTKPRPDQADRRPSPRRRAIVGLLKTAIALAEAERDEMEARS